MLGIVLQKSMHRLTRAETHRIVDLKITDEIPHQHLRHVVEGDAKGLEALRTVLSLQTGHQLRGGLAMRTGGVQEFQADYLALVLAEKQLPARLRQLDSEFRSLARDFGSR